MGSQSHHVEHRAQSKQMHNRHYKSIGSILNVYRMKCGSDRYFTHWEIQQKVKTFYRFLVWILKKILMSGQSHHITPILYSELITCNYQKAISSSLKFHCMQFEVDRCRIERNIQQNLRNFYRFQSWRRFLATEASASLIYASASVCGFRTRHVPTLRWLWSWLKMQKSPGNETYIT